LETSSSVEGNEKPSTVSITGKIDSKIPLLVHVIVFIGMENSIINNAWFPIVDVCLTVAGPQ
jgi:hypothetical protein